MGRSSLFILLTACAVAALASTARADAPAPLPIADLKRATPVEFEKEIRPVHSANCLACHNRTKAKADLVLETPADMLKGGENGPAIVPKRSADSLLLKLAAHQQDPAMPPKDNKVAAANLTPEQLGLLKLWIDQGAAAAAPGGGAGPSAPTVNWQPLPESLKAIYAVALTADGRFVACSRGNRIYVYSLPTRRLVAELADGQSTPPGTRAAAHRDEVQSLAFSPDGGVLASGGYREVKLWRRPRDVRRFAVTSAARGAVGAAAASPAGKTLATGGDDGVVRLWDASAAGRPLRDLSGHTAAVRAVRFAPDGKRVASASADKTVRVWNVETGTVVATATVAADPLALAWAGAGKQLITGGADGVVRVWTVPDAAGAEMPQAKELKGHEGALTCLDVVPPAAAQVVTGGADGSVRVWNLENGQAIRKMDQGGPVAAVAVRADGKRFVSAGLNNVAKLWDAEGKPVAELKGDLYATEQVRQRERDAALAAAEAAYRKTALQNAEKRQADEVARVKKAALADTEAEKPVAEKKKAVGQGDDAAKKKADAELKTAEAAKAAAADELHLAIKLAQQSADALADAQGALQAAETEQKRVEAEVAPAKAAAAAAEKAVRAVAFSPDGMTVATAGDDGLVHTWAAETGTAVETFRGHQGTVGALTFAGNDAVVSGGADGAAFCWDLRPAWDVARALGAGDSAAASASPFLDRVNALDFSPDGRLLATGGGVPSREGEIILWDAASGALVRKLDRVHSDTVFSLHFSPDGKRLASSAADRFAKIVDVADGKVLKQFEGHTGHVLAVGWKRDGRTIASGSADNAIKVWDADAGAQRKTIQGFDKEVTSVQFVGDTDQVLASSGDGKVRLVKADGGDVRQFPGAGGFEYAAAATRDGAVVIAGGEDGILRVWEGATGKEIVQFPVP
jgi:WD40 repeat protein